MAATGRRFPPGKAVRTATSSPFPEGRGLGVGPALTPARSQGDLDSRLRGNDDASALVPLTTDH